VHHHIAEHAEIGRFHVFLHMKADVVIARQRRRFIHQPGQFGRGNPGIRVPQQTAVERRRPAERFGIESPVRHIFQDRKHHRHRRVAAP